MCMSVLPAIRYINISNCTMCVPGPQEGQKKVLQMGIKGRWESSKYEYDQDILHV